MISADIWGGRDKELRFGKIISASNRDQQHSLLLPTLMAKRQQQCKNDEKNCDDYDPYEISVLSSVLHCLL
jgi:hypothetical protein